MGLKRVQKKKIVKCVTENFERQNSDKANAMSQPSLNSCTSGQLNCLWRWGRTLVVQCLRTNCAASAHTTGVLHSVSVVAGRAPLALSNPCGDLAEQLHRKIDFFAVCSGQFLK